MLPSIFTNSSPAIPARSSHSLEPTAWQNYINTVAGGAVQGSQERSAAGFAFGTLVNNANGNYTYIFATDIRRPAANPCPAPCTDARGSIAMF